MRGLLLGIVAGLSLVLFGCGGGGKDAGGSNPLPGEKKSINGQFIADIVHQSGKPDVVRVRSRDRATTYLYHSTLGTADSLTWSTNWTVLNGVVWVEHDPSGVNPDKIVDWPLTSDGSVYTPFVAHGAVTKILRVTEWADSLGIRFFVNKYVQNCPNGQCYDNTPLFQVSYDGKNLNQIRGEKL